MLTHKGTENINTERLLLRRFEGTDSNDMFKNWANDIGGISIVKLDEKNYSCEIGYCMSRGYWGKGIMSESLKLLNKHKVLKKICINELYKREVPQREFIAKIFFGKKN